MHCQHNLAEQAWLRNRILLHISDFILETPGQLIITPRCIGKMHMGSLSHNIPTATYIPRCKWGKLMEYGLAH